MKETAFDIMEQGTLLQVKCISHCSKNLEKAQVADRQAKSAHLTLKDLDVPFNAHVEYCDSFSDGSGIMLWAVYSQNDEIDQLNPVILGADSLGKRGKPAEEVGKEAAENLLKEIKSTAPVDSHLEDNLIPFMALSGGKIKVPEITGHTLTNIYVTEKFLDVKFDVDKENKVISLSQ